MSTNRKYVAEFKREAVELSYQGESSVNQIAQALGINVIILHRWRAEMQQEGGEAFPGHGNIKASEKEVSEL